MSKNPALAISGILCCAASTAALGFAPQQFSAPRGPESANQPRPAGQSESGTQWELMFDDGIKPEEYAKQLDFFGIEIGAVAKNGKTDYISKLTAHKPDKRVGNKSTEYRFRIGWKQGTLHAVDRKLLAKAGISSENKELLHYFPAKIQAQLSDLERSYAGPKTNGIRRTRFAIRPKSSGKGYEFVVVEQDPPRPAEQTTKSSSNRQAKP